MSSSSLLISPSALAQRMKESGHPGGSSKIRLLDATWYMPGTPKDPRKEFSETGPRIPGSAEFWDVEEVADKTHPLKLGHMMPDAKTFADACSRLGIERDSEVVIWDRMSGFSSPRAAFTFKTFSHDKVYVLDGGLPRWIAEGHPTEDGTFSKAPHQEITYDAPTKDEGTIRSYEEIVKNTERDPEAAEAELVLDARPAGRFTGADPEPRPGLSSGHMPHSLSLPFNSLRTKPSSTSPPFQTMLPREELRQVFLQTLGGDEKKLQDVLAGKKKVVNSCGSGMTAAIIWLALRELGAESAIYDESWTGYASRKESKILRS